MKTIFALLIAISTSAFAAEMTVMDTALPLMSTYDSSADARFQVDSTTGEGSVTATVTEFRWVIMGGNYDQWGRYYPNRVQMPTVIFKESVKVEGLALHGDQVIFAGAEGDVNCGRLGQSTVLRRPTIFLTGKCKLQTKITGNWSKAHLKVILITK